MKINIEHFEKLEKAIKEAEGRATSRTVTVESIVDILNGIAKKYDIPKSKLHGAKLHYDGGEHFPSACFKCGSPMSTHWTAENVRGKCYITDIKRDYCPSRSTSSGRIEYSDVAKEAILKKASQIY